ncbi:HalOD1 output domain-containing protein [Natrinema marinum]|uniref:HalOD1 output domain-containing protein n=1 Tax=Natrinema marinum TaxID=2961598 RepID=UPI0020C88DDF|nr:HalOD1 output domain-containing protein [Natrinema marinum]
METEITTDESRSQGAGEIYQAAPSQTLTEAVVEAIASASGLDTLEIADEFGPLYDVIDPSALDSLFQSGGGPSPAVGSVTFEYGDYRVTVDETGRVELAEQA